jgi:pimeloyl-ACP methyl ester carboxylesterase
MMLAEKPTLVADDWVQRMIDTPGRSAYQNIDGHVTHCLEWGDPANPRVMLLLHGFLGNAHWWDFIAPWFAADYRVVAIDFWGMGDSGARGKYTNQLFVDQIGAVLRSISSPVTLVGHSFGGRIAVFAAHEFSEHIARGIIVDTKLGFPDRPIRPRFTPRPKRLYPDLETVYGRFRFVPEEPPVLPAIMQHLARHSAKRVDGGYLWKFDGALMGGVDWQSVTEGELLEKIGVPLDFIAGELSEVVPSDLGLRIGKALRNGRGPIIIPSAHHHIPVNQPLVLVAALRALLIGSATP